MTSNQNQDPNALYPMRHPDLGDVLQVPSYAVPLREEMGYEHVTDEDSAPAEVPPALPAPTPAATTRATTSGTAKTPGPDDGQPVVNPAN